MRLVIDETSWRFEDVSSAECIEALEALLDVLDIAHEQKVESCYSDELFTSLVYQNKTFYDLYEPGSPVPIPHEVKERIGSIFARLPKWQELPLPWPPAFEVCINGGLEEVAPSVAWAHSQTIPDPAKAVACIVFPAGRHPGISPVTVATEVATLCFVANHQHYCEFFRWLITETTSNPAEMENLALSAFPFVDFVEGAFNGIKKMSKPYRELVGSLVLHLGAFSDHGKRIFSGPWQDAEAEFGSLRVEISDENGKTKRDSGARKQRTITVDGNEIVFWWHSKIERHQDRIHIYPDRIPSGGRLLVGIFCRHLK